MPGVFPQNFLYHADDGLYTRNFGPWTKEKLFYLGRYLKILSVSMKNRTWGDLNYIDLFCGSGKCEIEKTREIIFGSPLIALSLDDPFSNLFFADNSQINIDVLQQRCSQSQLFNRIHFYKGDSNKKVHEIISDITFLEKINGKGPNTSLNCAFLDPDGLELDWNTIITLAKLPKMDLIIFYPQNAINREILKEIKMNPPTRIDRYLGNEEWRQIIIDHSLKRPSTFHRTLINNIKSSLKQFGYSFVEDSGLEPLIKTEKKAPFYRLIYASKHKLGEKFWSFVINRDPYGQRRLC